MPQVIWQAVSPAMQPLRQLSRSLHGVPVSHADSSEQQFVSAQLSQVTSMLMVNEPQPVDPPMPVPVVAVVAVVVVVIDPVVVVDVACVPLPPVPLVALVVLPVLLPHAAAATTAPTLAAHAQIFMLLDLQPTSVKRVKPKPLRRRPAPRAPHARSTGPLSGAA
jgi:hypothetical protein